MTVTHEERNRQKRDWKRKRRAELGLPFGPVRVEHGGGARGRKDCRCDLCVAKFNEYRRQRYKKLGHQ